MKIVILHCLLKSLSNKKLQNIQVEMLCINLCNFQQEPVELMAMYGDSLGTSGMDVKSDHTKVSAKKAWEKNGYCKLPG